MRQALAGRACASSFAEIGLVLGIAAHERGRPAAAAPRPWAADGCRSRRPQAGRGLDADDVGQAHLASVRCGRRCRRRSRRRPAPRLCGTPADSAARIWSSAISGLVRKTTSSGTPALARRVGIVRPGLGQIEPLGDRQAGVVVAPPTGSPRSGSCPACRADRNTAAPRRPSACPSSGSRCHRRSRRGSVRAARSLAAPRARTAASTASSDQSAFATK